MIACRVRAPVWVSGRRGRAGVALEPERGSMHNTSVRRNGPFEGEDASVVGQGHGIQRGNDCWGD